MPQYFYVHQNNRRNSSKKFYSSTPELAQHAGTHLFKTISYSRNKKNARDAHTKQKKQSIDNPRAGRILTRWTAFAAKSTG